MHCIEKKGYERFLLHFQATIVSLLKSLSSTDHVINFNKKILIVYHRSNVSNAKTSKTKYFDVLILSVKEKYQQSYIFFVLFKDCLYLKNILTSKFGQFVRIDFLPQKVTKVTFKFKNF